MALPDHQPLPSLPSFLPHSSQLLTAEFLPVEPSASPSLGGLQRAPCPVTTPPRHSPRAGHSSAVPGPGPPAAAGTGAPAAAGSAAGRRAAAAGRGAGGRGPAGTGQPRAGGAAARSISSARGRTHSEAASATQRPPAAPSGGGARLARSLPLHPPPWPRAQAQALHPHARWDVPGCLRQEHANRGSPIPSSPPHPVVCQADS